MLLFAVAGVVEVAIAIRVCPYRGSLTVHVIGGSSCSSCTGYAVSGCAAIGGSLPLLAAAVVVEVAVAIRMRP